MFQTLSLAFSFIFFLILFFSIIDLPHLAIEDKRQETSGGDKLPHDLDKKSEKRETHTNPFIKKKKKRPNDKKREKGDKLLLLHTLSLCRRTLCFPRINHHKKEGELLFLRVEI